MRYGGLTVLSVRLAVAKKKKLGHGSQSLVVWGLSASSFRHFRNHLSGQSHPPDALVSSYVAHDQREEWNERPWLTTSPWLGQLFNPSISIFGFVIDGVEPK